MSDKQTVGKITFGPRLTPEEQARHLLERLRQWDVLAMDKGDGPYWRREIDALLTDRDHTQFDPGAEYAARYEEERLRGDTYRARALALVKRIGQYAEFRADMKVQRRVDGEAYAELYAQLDAERARADRLAALLKRLGEWDMFDTLDKADGAYWRAEIDAALAGHAADGPGAAGEPPVDSVTDNRT